MIMISIMVILKQIIPISMWPKLAISMTTQSPLQSPHDLSIIKFLTFSTHIFFCDHKKCSSFLQVQNLPTTQVIMSCVSGDNPFFPNHMLPKPSNYSLFGHGKWSFKISYLFQTCGPSGTSVQGNLAGASNCLLQSGNTLPTCQVSGSRSTLKLSQSALLISYQGQACDMTNKI